MADDRKTHQSNQQSAWDEVMGSAKKTARKVKEGLDYVNKNINPLTSDSSKKRGSEYMKRAGSDTPVGRVLTRSQRLDKLSQDD